MKGKETKEREREGREENKGEICEKGGQECRLGGRIIFYTCTHTHAHHTHHSLDEFHLDTSSDNLNLDSVPPCHLPSVEDFGRSLLVG